IFFRAISTSNLAKASALARLSCEARYEGRLGTKAELSEIVAAVEKYISTASIENRSKCIN
ncbi:MAG: hypothetical protein IJU43_04590, partial [Lachnospiraceae bacterium]|nr:hypothetical protein [Lachnospiraceae bacterium]